MYWNVVKREVKTNSFVKIVKSFSCYGLNDYDIKFRAERYSWFRNLFRYFRNKHYYKVEFDFE
jgi:hypothetical protein